MRNLENLFVFWGMNLCLAVRFTFAMLFVQCGLPVLNHRVWLRAAASFTWLMTGTPPSGAWLS